MKHIRLFLLGMTLLFALNANSQIYTQGFNGGSIPADWTTVITNDPGTDPAITFETTSEDPLGLVPTEGTHLVRFNSYDCGTNASIRLYQTVPFATTGGLSGVNVTFDWATDDDYTNNDRVVVQYSLDGTTWNDVSTYSRASASAAAWNAISCPLPVGALNQATVYLAFHFISAYGNNCHLDNLVVNGVTAPALLATPNPLTFGYVPIGNSLEQSYTLGGLNLTGGPGVIVVTAPAYYEVSLTSGSGFSSSINVPYVTSTLLPTTIYARLSPTGIPADYIGNITNVGGGANLDVAVTGSSFLPYCASTSTSSGSYFSDFSTTGGTLNISNLSSGYSLNGFGSFTTMFVAQLQTGVVNFNTTIVGPTVGVGIWVDWDQNGLFTEAGEEVFMTTGYVSTCTGSFVVPLTATLGNTRMRIRLDWNDPTPSACGVIARGETEDYIFTVQAAPSCLAPTLLSAGTITVNSAELSWTTGGATIWNIEYGPAGFTPGTGTMVHNVTTNQLTLNGLSANTSYDCYVQDSCGVNDNSTWTGPLTFATVCAPVAVLPWVENFDGVVIPAFPSCWTYENGDWETVDNDNSTYDANARSGTQFLTNAYSATNEFIWTPGFELTAGTSYDFSFWWAGDDYDEWTGDVFYNSAASSIGATQLGASFVVPATVTDTIYQEFKNSFVPATTGVYYFAIRVNASFVPYYLSFDDFRMELTPVTDIAVIQTDIDECDTLGLFAPPITLYNTGNTVIPTGQNIDISYQVDGGGVVVNTITLAADLNPAGNTMVMFTTPYLFNQFVTYSCMMAASLTGDLIQTNDTAEFYLNLNHAPIVNLGHDTTLCSNETILLDAGNPGATYSWWNGSSTSTHLVDSTFVGGVGTANFWVNVTDINGCSSRDTISVTWSICTGIDQIENISMTIMPNPTNGVFTVDFGGLTGSTYVEISDLTGKVAISETLNLTGIERASYDLSAYAKGIYNIRIVNNSQVAVRKIVVN